MAGFGDIATDAASGASIGGPWGAFGGAALGLGSAAFGLYQANQAKKLMAANPRPTYEIPPEIQANLSDAQRMSLEGLPDEQKEQYINNLQRSQSFGLNAMNTRKAGLAGLGGIVQSGNEGYNTLLSEDAQARQRNIQNLMAQRSNMADYKNAAFETNQLAPYLRNDAYAKGIQGAGINNIFGGLGTTAHSLSFLDGKPGSGNANPVGNPAAGINYQPTAGSNGVGGYGQGVTANGAGYGLGFDPNGTYE